MATIPLLNLNEWPVEDNKCVTFNIVKEASMNLYRALNRVKGEEQEDDHWINSSAKCALGKLKYLP